MVGDVSEADAAGVKSLERIAELAARALAVPFASIAFDDGETVTIEASYGYDASLGCPIDDLAFCREIAAKRDVMAIPADPLDPRFERGRSVYGIHSGAAVPLFGRSGASFGTLCVFDRAVREFDAAQRDQLRAVGALAAEQLDVHATLREVTATRDALVAIADASPLAVVSYDVAGNVTGWNLAAERLYGWSAAHVLGGRDPSLAPEAAEREMERLAGVLGSGRVLLGERARRRRHGGNDFDVRLSAAPLFDASGRVTRVVTIVEDTQPLDIAERRLALLESVVLLTDVPIAITSVEPLDDPELIYVNDAFARAFGYGPAEMTGLPGSVLRESGYAAELLEEAARARKLAVPYAFEFAGRRKDGERVWFEQNLSPVFAEDGTCEAFVIMLRDITVRRSQERLLHERGHVLELIAADAPLASVFAAIVESAERSASDVSASIVLERDGGLHVFACGERIRDAAGGAFPVVPVGDPQHPSAVAFATCEQVETHAAALPDEGFGETARRFGIDACLSTPIRLSDGSVAGTFELYFFSALVSASDTRAASEFAHLVGIAAERHSDRERLEHLAHHDAVTDLPNRALFERRIETAIALAAERGRFVAVAVCDLDRFKIVNESLGHAAGDQLLREIAGRLDHAARPGDFLARLGGDEFVVIFDDLATRDEAATVARRMLSAVRPSFNCGGQEVFVRACMGISVFPDDGRDPDDLLALCDGALYAAKARGADLAFYEMGEPQMAASRLALETSLNHALANDEFDVRFQPIVDLRTRRVRGAEALLRWRHPLLGEVFPDDFIYVAEETGLIVPIGAWVLETACRFAKRWQDDGAERFVSVNVSARQFDRRDFVETVTGALARARLEPHRLHLEVTESLVMRSPEAARATLSQLKALGVKISVDDFGTGYSSFTYLKRFSLDALKIDRTFVRDVGVGGGAKGDEAIVRAIVAVARALDLEVVAEGVETEAQARFMGEIGVSLAQGYLFAPAIPADDAYAWHAADGSANATFSVGDAL